MLLCSGSESPVPCPVGTNSSSRGLTKESDCPLCVGGYYCNETGTVFAVHQCVAGYYCPSGSIESNLTCPTGSSCKLGSIEPEECAAGYYQDLSGQPSCEVILVLFLLSSLLSHTFAAQNLKYQNCSLDMDHITFSVIKWV